VPLRSALLALARLKTHELENNSRVSEELETVRAVEESLLSQLAEVRAASQALHEGLESDLRRAQDNVQILRVDNDRLNTALQEERAAMNSLRSEFHTCQQKMGETLQTTQVMENSFLAHIKDIEMKYTS
jgi:hypothetical protein